MVQHRRRLQQGVGAAARARTCGRSRCGSTTCAADDVNNVDLSIIKNTHARRARTLQFRFEALNAFNHPLFPSPGGNSLTPTAAAVRFDRQRVDAAQLRAPHAGDGQVPVLTPPKGEGKRRKGEPSLLPFPSPFSLLPSAFFPPPCARASNLPYPLRAAPRTRGRIRGELT